MKKNKKNVDITGGRMLLRADEIGPALEKLPFESFEAEYKRLRRMMILKRQIERDQERIRKAQEKINQCAKEIEELKARQIDWKAAA